MFKGAAFDYKAEQYDRAFTHTYVGKSQRESIHHFVSTKLEGKSNLEILELNCGTGEDISFLRKFGNVLATDISEEMLKIASMKNPDVDIRKIDLNVPISLNKKFDVIFSNFGGFNCLSPKRIKELNVELADLLNEDGQIFIVLMHRWSLTEFLYFTCKLKFKKAFRRLVGKAFFDNIPIYYYSNSQTTSLFNSFRFNGSLPTGILLSGEYMNEIGQKVGIHDTKVQWLSPVLGADHFLFNFIKVK